MSAYLADAFRAPAPRPPSSPPQLHKILPTDQRILERQRSSSLSDAPARTNGRVGGTNEAPSLMGARRRSSGGRAGTAQSKGGAFGLGRRDSSRAPFRSPPLPAHSQSGSALPTLRTFESFGARNVAAALDPGIEQLDDEWQQVCVRVLPLFNGEGIRGFVEDLNELVLTHVQRTFTRCQTSATRSRQQQPSLNLSSLVTGLLTAELTDLIHLGCATLSAKLTPPSPAFPLSDDRLLSRLNEIWLFFFTGILPHIEAVFWVLRCDDRLRAAVGDTWQERERQTRPGQASGRIDIRRIALIEFRDQIIHPEIDRLERLFTEMYRPAPLTAPPSRAPSTSPTPQNDYSLPTAPDFRRSRSQPGRRASISLATPSGLAPHPQPQRQHSSPSRLSPDPSYLSTFPSSTLPTPTSTSRFPVSPTSPTPSSLAPSPALTPAHSSLSPLPAAAAQSLARRRQMVAVLSSLLTADDRQAEMDALLRIMRPVPAPTRAEQAATALRSMTRSPDQLDTPGDGPGTGLTASPVMMDEPAALGPEPSPSLSVGGGGGGGDGLLPPPVPPVVAQRIDARQRSRTMDSLEEEDGAEGFVHVPPFLAALGGRPSPLSRHSTDGTTPTVSLFSGGGAEAGGGQVGDKAEKKKRRRSFLPRIGRSNSQASTGTVGTTTGGESTEEDTASVSGMPGGLAVPSSVAMGAAGTAKTSGDKLRRGLLRRNSSRKAAEMVHALGALETASGFAIEDDEE
ncbi:hypothetical protein JCM8097_001640 [Rhodosporidiobolus ruineniae]